MGQLERNLYIAEATVKYVESRMTHGASNKPDDVLHSKMKADALARTEHEEAMKNANVFSKGILWMQGPQPKEPGLTTQSAKAQRNAMVIDRSLPIIEQLLAEAAVIEGTGIGNCGEQATVGFGYLYARRDMPKFALALFGTNHEFLVLGVPRMQLIGTFPLGVAPLWPDEAVICDPWYHEWFGVAEGWTRRGRSILARTEGQAPANVKIGVVASVEPQRQENPLYRKEPKNWQYNPLYKGR